MLCKAARRRHALQYLWQTSEQFHLPWLCPALYTSPPKKAQSRSISNRPSPCSLLAKVSPSRSPRRPASAVASPDVIQSDGYLELESRRGAQSSNSSLQYSLSDIPSQDPDRFLILDDTVAEPPERISSNKIHHIQIRGNAQEIKTTMEACLQVHRFDRAIALLRQLQVVVNSNSPYLREAFNDCLQAMVTNMIVNNDKSNNELINQWVEVDMHKAGVEPDARTYALKVKAALATMTGSQRDRTARRYWELARQSERMNEVASLRDILSEQDLGKLSEIAPQMLTDNDHEDYHTSDGLVEIVNEPALAQRPVDEVLETGQKGLGLTSLRKSLSLFTRSSQTEDHAGEAGHTSTEARQLRLEADSIDTAIERWHMEFDKMAKMRVRAQLEGAKLAPLLWEWHSVLSGKIRDELKLVDAAEAKERRNKQEKVRCEYGPFLRLLDPDHLAALATISILEVTDKNSMSTPLRLTRLVGMVGRIVEAEVRAEQERIASLDAKIFGKAKKNTSGSRARSARSNSRPQSPSPAQSRSHTRYRRSSYDWGETIHTRIGAVLCEFVFDTAKIRVSKEDPATGKLLHASQPVFSRSTMFQAGRRFGVVTIHPDFVEMMMKEPPGALIAKHLPMVCEPKPWTGFREGGFLETPTNFCRVKRRDFAQRGYAEAAAERGDLDQVFAGVDVLGKTGWKVHRDVFEVMLKAWNSGEAVANLSPLQTDFEMPEKPMDSSDRVARTEWYRAMKKIENEKAGLHSSRCFQNLQMEIAKAYLDETFYLPHNIDFRGRAYPIPPYLNQMGSDNCRGLLLFANGRELGEDGLRWLKIHLANVFGYDKANLKDRENFPAEHLSDIADSVNHPLDGKRWWLEAEEPWQCLATCFELKKALDLPDPTKYVSHLPVHQDGSCNGLQHYAALGGDIAGAKQVNLEPGDKPADIYTGVAELVKAEVKQEAAAGNEVARALDGRITRKIVKQTVMTNVYGVTFLGAIRQVKRQFEDLMPDLHKSSDTMLTKGSAYIAGKIFKALGVLFSGAHDIQYWLGDCATKISTSLSPAQLQRVLDAEDKGNLDQSGSGLRLSHSKQAPSRLGPLSQVASFRSSVIWTTPLRLPVVQPYRISNGRRIQTNLQDIILSEPTIADVVDKRKQLQAFPPNFIHSLDATHMLLSALKCHEVGITFSAVHDSFWTHAADVNTLNRLLRDAFIRMHSEDIIGRLAAEFRARYKDHMYLASVRGDTELGKAIKGLRKTLHGSVPGSSADRVRHLQYAELVLEARRQHLLKSGDAVERERGKQIESPGSLFEAMDGDRYLTTRESLGKRALGALPQQAEQETLEKALQFEDTAAHERLAEVPCSFDDIVDVPEDDVGDSEDIEANVEVAEKQAEKQAKGKSAKKAASGPVWLWIPLTLKPVPQKGAFDVTRLRDSQYFFS